MQPCKNRPHTSVFGIAWTGWRAKFKVWLQVISIEEPGRWDFFQFDTPECSDVSACASLRSVNVHGTRRSTHDVPGTADDETRDGGQGDGLHAARRGVDAADHLGGGAGTGRWVVGRQRAKVCERFVTDRVEIEGGRDDRLPLALALRALQGRAWRMRGSCRSPDAEGTTLLDAGSDMPRQASAAARRRGRWRATVGVALWQVTFADAGRYRREGTAHGSLHASTAEDGQE